MDNLKLSRQEAIEDLKKICKEIGCSGMSELCQIKPQRRIVELIKEV